MFVLSTLRSFLPSSLVFALVTFFFLALFNTAFAADVLLTPSTGSYSTGQTFTATIQVDPAGDSVNAVEASLSFNTSVLSVVSVSKAGSVFSLWTTEPAFSNTAGTITFGGGSPTPFSARSNLLTVTFRANAAGTGAVNFTKASALAADGLGTDVLKASPGATYTIGAATAPPPVAETPTPTPTQTPSTIDDVAIAFGDPPRAPEVGSQAFLDPDVWYRITEGVFTWELPFDVNRMRLEIATSADHQPTTEIDPPVEEFSVNSQILFDGIQYLSIQFGNQVGWGAVTNRQIKIDTTAPEPFEIKVQAGTTPSAFPLLIFDAQDETSGISHYKLTIAGREPIDVTPGEARLGYLLGALEDGTYTVTVVAYDMAGNSTESTKPVLITSGWLPPSEDAAENPFWLLLAGKNLIIILLVLVVAGQFAFIIYDRKQTRKQEEKLRKETREIQDQMEKIFSALRDEIYDQINDITKRPRLSKKEKEAVEGLNQALEVSETLIEKEINDVKKILK